MATSVKIFACAVLCSSIVIADAAPIMALPTIVSPSTIAGASAHDRNIEQVQFRDGRRYRGNNYRRGNGVNIALGIGAAIIGGIVLSEAARAEHRSSHGSAWNRCAETFRSFDSDTGTYIGYDGVQRTCPYLR